MDINEAIRVAQEHLVLCLSISDKDDLVETEYVIRQRIALLRFVQAFKDELMARAHAETSDELARAEDATYKALAAVDDALK